MATSSSSGSPRRGGSHFSTPGAPGPASRTDAPDLQSGASAPHPVVPAGGAAAPRSALTTGRVSSRTAAATRRAGAHAPSDPRASRGGSRVPVVLIGLLVVLALAAVVAFVVVPMLFPGGGAGTGEHQLAEEGTEVTITIPEGSGAAAVAQVLYDNGLIADQSAFLSEVRRTEAEASIKSGSYLIVAGTDDTDIIALLTTGPNATTAGLTIPEGYTVSQVAAAVEWGFGIPADEFIAQAKASTYVADYPFLEAAAAEESDSLEGYLFPKTYDFSSETDVTADAVIRAMLDQYQTELSSAGIDLDSAAATLSERYGIDVDAHDVLTMASIVEREAVTDEQRPRVASVFYNRLAAGMRLQSDATLTYSLGRAATADEINTLDDPYNTNLRDGLTPTPICSPSLASIQAAIEPSEEQNYYFYITQDTEQFSETYDEHQQAYS